MKNLAFSIAAFACSIVCNCQSLDDSLLVYYSFNGSAEDLSDNEFDAEVFGATLVDDRFGNPNSAYYFDGIDDFIELPNSEVLKPDLPVSFSFWVRYETLGPNKNVVFNSSFQEDISCGVYLTSQSGSNRYACGYGDGSSSYSASSRRTYVSNSVIDTENWHQIVVVVRDSTNMEIWVDCEETSGEFSGSGNPLFYSTSPGELGRHDQNMELPAYYFNGTLDDFRYWNRALTEVEILNLCNNTEICMNDSLPPTFSSISEIITLSCGDEIPPIPEVVATDNLTGAEVTFDVETDTSNCQPLVERIWTATDGCMNTSQLTQVINYLDDEPPIFDFLPLDQEITCELWPGDVPQVVVFDNCDGNVDFNFSQTFVGDSSITNCSIGNPIDTASLPDWAMQLNWSNDIENVQQYSLIEGQYEQTDEGIVIYGHFEDIQNSAAGWDAVFLLDDPMTWWEWSEQDFPTSYKQGAVEIGDNFIDWTYMLLSSESILTGWGEYDNSLIYLSHFPEDKYYGFQQGIGANSINMNEGFGGWISFSGVLQGIPIEGTGDVALDVSCCLDLVVENSWVATDCSGNQLEWTQTISLIPSNLGYNYVCLGDFNEDYARTVMDLLILLGELGCQTDCPADMDNNQVTNVLDLLLLIQKIGVPCY